MRSRLVKTVIFVAVAIGVAVGAANAAGAMEGLHFDRTAVATDGNSWS